MKMNRLGRAVAVLLVLSLGVGILTAAASAQEGTAGAYLAQDVTSSDPAQDGAVHLDSVVSFDPDGGTATIEPGSSSEEIITYAGTDTETNRLLNVNRTQPLPHSFGSFVQASAPSSSPTESPSPTPDASPSTTPGSDEPTTYESDSGGVDSLNSTSNVATADTAVGVSTDDAIYAPTPDVDPADADLHDYALDVAVTTASSLPLVGVSAAATCFGNSHNPHKSRHNKGYVAAKGETRCPGPVWVDMGVRSSLYKFFQQEKTFIRVAGPVSSTSEYFKNDQWRVSVRLTTPCPGGTGVYRLESFHWVYFVNGSYDDGNTANTAQVTC